MVDLSRADHVHLAAIDLGRPVAAAGCWSDGVLLPQFLGFLLGFRCLRRRATRIAIYSDGTARSTYGLHALLPRPDRLTGSSCRRQEDHRCLLRDDLWTEGPRPSDPQRCGGHPSEWLR